MIKYDKEYQKDVRCQKIRKWAALLAEATTIAGATGAAEAEFWKNELITILKYTSSTPNIITKGIPFVALNLEVKFRPKNITLKAPATSNKTMCSVLFGITQNPNGTK